MGSTRRNFTAEYKANAVILVIDDGRAIAEVARSIGVHEITLGKSVKKARDEGNDNSDRPLNEDERAELERLREEVKHARMEVEFEKSSDLVREKPAVKFAVIADWVESDSYPVTFICVQLGVSTFGYYKWRGKSRSARDLRDDELTTLIKCRYGHSTAGPAFGVCAQSSPPAATGFRTSGCGGS